jgi:hypothetical protein
MTFAPSVVIEPGTTYCLLQVRTDGSDTTPSGLFHKFDTMYGFPFMQKPRNTWFANNDPQPGDTIPEDVNAYCIYPAAQ